MTEIFVISDTHFGHANTFLLFKNPDGTPLRPFSSIEEMNETMINNWNRVVQPHDKVYHLGDVAINKKYIELVGRCNGHKRLIMGNHDIFDSKYYVPHFEKILSMRIFAHKCIMTHVPIHPECIARFNVNIHGHTHGNNVTGEFYFNASVEKINYTPISLDSILDSMK